ncbi:hypothetical protein EMPS_11091 [Entomortierella parvispora]|uniref:Uncharacterized protein n=1 Tax=Entomortierella parvispora TaxID=205924 RepID=A0A9P3HL87_9FUNG|nr:hypothetical protein EMPS_11091 [Entomortierella parvispora]
MMGHAGANTLLVRDNPVPLLPSTFQQESVHYHKTMHTPQKVSAPTGDDEVNFHDFIHSKHEDDKETDENRSAMSSPRHIHSRIARHANSTQASSLVNGANLGGNLHQSNDLDQIGNGNTTHAPVSTSEPFLSHQAMNPVFEGSTSSHIYPYHDLVPPPTQGLFRSLMEELQTQAALQRDLFLASTAKSGPGPEVMDHYNRALPKFMIEPFDFLSEDYESCVGQDSGSHSLQDNSVNMTMSSSHQPDNSEMRHSNATASVSASTDQVGSPGGCKKRALVDDSYGFEHHPDSTTTPPSGSNGHDQLSPPTQDLFRMLMEELETQAAIQRDQALASNLKAESDSMAAFNGSHYNQHHARLPRFVMEPLDFLSADYGSMQMDGSGSSRPTQGVYLDSLSSGAVTNTHPSTPPPMHTTQEHLSPPTQDLFRTLMEELEVQAAFQRDQVLAATTKSAPRVDPEEYAFNGQHLRPLPRFMFEPLDFLSADYESCMTSGSSGFHGGPSHGSHFFDPVRDSYMDVDFTSSPAPSMNHTSTTKDKDALPAKVTRQSSRGSSKTKSNQIRPKPVIIVASPKKDRASSLSTRPSAKKRKLLGETQLSPDTPSSLTILGGVAGSTSGSETSPVSPTFLSSLSISHDSPDSEGSSPSDESSTTATPTSSTSKRPWTPADEALLLKLFAKKTPIHDIARSLDRTVHSVRSRRQILTDPGFVKGKGHGVSRRCRQDPETTIKLPTYAQMAFLSLAWLPDMEGTLNDVATMVEKLFSRHLNRIPRTGHKNLQIWRAQISDALAHEKGQPRPRFESFGLKRGRQWVYRLTAFGRGMVEAMGGVDQICEDLLKNNSTGPASGVGENQATGDNGDGGSNGVTIYDVGAGTDADSQGKVYSSAGGAGIGQGQGYGYSYRPPDSRPKSVPRSRPRSDRRRAQAKLKKLQQSRLQNGEGEEEGGDMEVVNPAGDEKMGAANAIANAMEAMAAGLAKMMALEEKVEGSL